jgi:hypothetical protein
MADNAATARAIRPLKRFPMTIPNAPTRTPAGEDELRHRTRKLGQRYRTVLLLIDGRRSLEEVLGLAQQAGAAVSHFEELVRLELVEIPAAPVLAPAASVSGHDADEAMPAPLQPDEGDMLPTVPIEEPPSEPVTPSARALEMPPVAAQTLPEAQGTPEQQLLQQVRDLLIDTLRIDSPLFGARTFFRVRSAQSTGELIDLVWEIQDHLAHSRHSRDELISLHRARELLGMGNTRIAGETNPGPLPQ